MKPDQETAKILSEQEELMLLVKGKAWAIVRAKFLDKIVSLSDIFTLDEKDITKLAMELGARQMAAEILMKLLKEIEGTAAQYKTISDLYREAPDDLILRS